LAFSFQVADSTMYTIGYKPLDEAPEKTSGDYEAVLELAPTAARVKVAHDAMAAADPTTYEFSTHLDAQKKQIVASLATKAEGGDHPERALRPDAMPGDGAG
jgi:hypothetical protein